MSAVQRFQAFIQQFPDYTEAAFALAEPSLKVNAIKKGEHILQPDRICRDIHFVAAGIFKVYYLRNGVAVTTCFCQENRFTTSYQSLITNQPSELGIQAIEDAETVSIRYEQLQELYTQHSFWQQIGRMITEQEYVITACYTRLINDKSAKERYLEILHEEPELLQRVSLIDLASYLQLSPETISRIRKQLASS
jgi:CRP-like cAMP-binding protein